MLINQFDTATKTDRINYILQRIYSIVRADFFFSRTASDVFSGLGLG